jgi:hypothetical protein
MSIPVVELGIAVGIVIGYGLDGPGIKSQLGRDFPHLSRRALGPNQPPVQWVPALSPGVKRGRDVTLSSHPLLVPWSWKGRAIPLLPYRPYDLYRASVPVQGCTLPYGLYRASVPVQGCILPTTCTEPHCLYKGALYLTTCTEPQCLYNGALYRMACTEPQCLYNGSLYLTACTDSQCLYKGALYRTACRQPQCLYNGALYRTACTKPQCLYNGALYRTACSEPQCLYNGALYFLIFIDWGQSNWNIRASVYIKNALNNRQISTNIRTYVARAASDHDGDLHRN